MEKKEIRRYVKELKSQLSPEEKLNGETKVLEQLRNNAAIARCENLVAYWAMPDELPTRQIIEYFLQSKKIFLPVVCGTTLEFRRFESEKELKAEARYGIFEPTSEETLTGDGSNTVILVPGVAFTAQGLRLGRGGGYYDRILAQLPKAHKTGIALKCQLLDSLPVEQHDAIMDEVIVG
ncbi:MAG: 5-formyltetrahydrofolate cyclo-ligase [Bacteroidales bacterium]|nr:5-formyltetrahydrofolate cyclo-ligase [Bacteroidales bacterium]